MKALIYKTFLASFLATTPMSIALGQSVSAGAPNAATSLELPANPKVADLIDEVGPIASLSLISENDEGALALTHPDPDLHPHLAGNLEPLPSALTGDPFGTLDDTFVLNPPTPEAVLIGKMVSGETPWPAEVPTWLEGTLVKLYEARENRPMWYRDGAWDDDLDSALYQVENAHLDGLTPADYEIKGVYGFTQAKTTEEIVLAEMRLHAMILPYVSDMANGRYPEKRRYRLSKLVNLSLQEESLGTFMRGLIPQKIEYQRLRTLLAENRANRSEREQIPLFSPGPYLRMGDQDARVAELRTVLTKHGDYVPDPAVDLVPDFDPTVFDETLHQAVLAFQARKGLGADGIVGKGTRWALNLRQKTSIPLIKVNMERLRWEAPLNGEDVYVRVNIPQYRLHVRDKGKIAMDMRAIVGRGDRATPILSDRIVNLKFSPDWTVPSTIYREDILPALQANPGYAASAGYLIKRGGRTVNANSINWSNPPRVTVYKKPSANGPLGGVRFSMTNGIGIFLHDTNKKSLFRNSRRDLSSGCVRVGDPAGLAHYLANQDSNWSLSSIKRAMNKGQISWKKINGGAGVPVYLSYMTLYVDENGQVKTTRDPYGKDARLLRKFDSN